ncbi:hypothetical protein F503_07013 [Ophiostoma piceae UAMH 11346]|uniref:Alcohol acetyltransferase n=1 Tax=Ophiostoma piceae (strain UAMH 11346) TaxID=1262450 RepID=S3C8T0_OPHP1|nr:hypothetical protein F503_07013 [Ophiostoma piceae UAMH 11346]
MTAQRSATASAPAMALPQTVLRPLGTYEQYSSSRNALGLYRNVITVCRYALPAGLPPSEDQTKARITAALAAVVLERLPSLRVGIAGDDTKKPVFVTVPSLDLADHVEWVSRAPGLAADEYDALLARDLARDNARAWPNVETQPPWRLVVYLNTADGWADLAFALHHSVGDGKSGLMFHTHLVEVLNSPSPAAAAASSVLTFTVLPALVPAQEDLIKFNITWLFFIKTIWAELAPKWLKPAPTAAYYAGPRVALYEHVLDGPLRLFHLSPTQAAAVLAGCRAHGTTLTALIHGLQMVLFARRTPADVASAFACVMPITTRVAIAPSSSAPPSPLPSSYKGPVTLDVNRQMGNFVCAHKHVYEPGMVADARLVAPQEDEDKGKDDGKVWRAAAAVGAGLKARVANLKTDNTMGLLGWVSDWHQYWRQQDGKIRESTWSVSNTGAIADGTTASSTDSQWKLTRNFYSQSSLGKDSLISVNVGSVRGGDMSFVVAWHRGVVEDAFAHSYADDLRDCLVRYADTGHFAVPHQLEV